VLLRVGYPNMHSNSLEGLVVPRSSSRTPPSAALPRPARPSAETAAPPVDLPRLRVVLLALAAGATTAAGAVHFAVFAHEWDRHLAGGIVLATLAWIQVMWAAGVRQRPSTVLFAAGIGLNGLAVALFALALATPVGLGYGASEVTAVGIWAASFEVIAIVATLLLLPRFYSLALKPLPAAATTGSVAIITLAVAVFGTIAVLSAEL
jgi:hypothetical protein